MRVSTSVRIAKAKESGNMDIINQHKSTNATFALKNLGLQLIRVHTIVKPGKNQKLSRVYAKGRHNRRNRK